MSGYSIKILKLLTILLASMLTNCSLSQVSSPYTVKWYEVSTDTSFTNQSDDSLATQRAIYYYLQNHYNPFWFEDTYGIRYNGYVGINVASGGGWKLSVDGGSYGALNLTGDYEVVINHKLNYIGNREFTTVYDNDGTHLKVNGSRKIFLAYNSPNDLIYTNSTGVGILNTSPTAPLDVTGNVKLSGYLYATGLRNLSNSNILTYNASGELGYYNKYSLITDSLHWIKSGSDLYTKSGITNIGINDNTPEEELTINGIENIFTKIHSTGSGSDAGFILQNDQVAWYFYNKGDYNNSFRIVDNTHATIPFVIEENTPNYTTYLDNGGYVGFGKSNPAYKIDVAGFGSFDSTVIVQNPHNVTGTYFAMIDDNGKIVKTDTAGLLGSGGISITLEDLTDGFGISDFTYNGTTPEVIEADSSELVTHYHLDSTLAELEFSPLDSLLWYDQIDTTVNKNIWMKSSYGKILNDLNIDGDLNFPSTFSNINFYSSGYLYIKGDDNYAAPTLLFSVSSSDQIAFTQYPESFYPLLGDISLGNSGNRWYNIYTTDLDIDNSIVFNGLLTSIDAWTETVTADDDTDVPTEGAVWNLVQDSALWYEQVDTTVNKNIWFKSTNGKLINDLKVEGNIIHTPFDITMDDAHDDFVIWDSTANAYGKLSMQSLLSFLPYTIDTTKHHTVGYGLNGTFFNMTDNQEWEVDTNEITTWNDTVSVDGVGIATKNDLLGLGSGNVEDGDTTGQILFWDNGAGQYKHTTTTEMFWDDVNKRLGVGWNTPDGGISVKGTLRANMDVDGFIGGYVLNDVAGAMGFNIYIYGSTYATTYLRRTAMFYGSANTYNYELYNPQCIHFNIGTYNSEQGEKLNISANETFIRNYSSNPILTLEALSTTVVANATMGKLSFKNRDVSTTTNYYLAEIEAQATNTITTNINPGRLIFKTTPTTVAAPLTEAMRITEDQKIGIGTTAPDKQVEINNSTGNALRLTYNDSDGSATYYTDFNVDGSGNLTIDPSGTTLNVNDEMYMDGTYLRPYSASGLSLGSSTYPFLTGDFSQQVTINKSNDDAVLLLQSSGASSVPHISIENSTNGDYFDLNLNTSGGLDFYDRSTTTTPFTIQQGGLDNSLMIKPNEVVVNEDGTNQDVDFRVEGKTSANLLFTDAYYDRVGIKQSSPESPLDINGSIALPIVLTTATTYQLTNANHTLLVDNNQDGGVARTTVSTDAAASDMDGRIYIIKLYGANDNDVGFTFDPYGSETIYLSEASSATSFNFDVEGGSVTLQSYNGNWYIIDFSGNWSGW